MRVAFRVSFLALTLAAPVVARAQQVQSFADLPLRINRDGRVRVVDQSGAKVIGRVVGFGRDGLSITTSGGERRFADETVRRVDRSGMSKARGALIGAGTFLIIGLTGCPEDSARGCPVFAALLWGAPLGTLIGAWVPSMHEVYRAQPNRPPSVARPARGATPSLLEDLGMRVNLGDRLIIESASGGTTEGVLKGLDDDALTLGDKIESSNARFARENIRRVTVQRSHVRRGTLLGFLAGSAWGMALVASDTALKDEWIDAMVLLGGPGAAVGALVGRMVHRRTVVYPAEAPRVTFTPVIIRDRVGVRASLRL